MNGTERTRKVRIAHFGDGDAHAPNSRINDAARDRRAPTSPGVWPCLDGCREPPHLLMLERRLQLLIEANPLNMELKTAWISLQRAVAIEDFEAGWLQKAEHRLNCASKAVNEMLSFDPTHEVWLNQRDALDQDLSKFALA